MNHHEFELFLHEELKDKSATINKLIKKSQNKCTREDLLEYLADNNKFVKEKESVFFAPLKNEKDRINTIVYELVKNNKSFISISGAALEIKKHLKIDRPKSYYIKYLKDFDWKNFYNISIQKIKTKEVLYQKPDQNEQKNIVSIILNLLEQKHPKTFTKIIQELKVKDVFIPCPEILLEILDSQIKTKDVLVIKAKKQLTLPPRPVKEQIIESCQKNNSGIELAKLKRLVKGYTQKVIQQEIKSLIKSGEIHIQKKNRKNYFFCGKGNSAKPETIDSLLVQLKHIQKKCKEFCKMAKPVQNKAYGKIYPQKEDIEIKGKELYTIIENLYDKYCSLKNITSLHRIVTAKTMKLASKLEKKDYKEFKKEATKVINDLIKRDDEDFVRIWEIRERMNGWTKQIFDTFLLQMEKDDHICVIEHSDPRSVTTDHKKASIMDDLKGLLFYVMWRE